MVRVRPAISWGMRHLLLLLLSACSTTHAAPVDAPPADAPPPPCEPPLVDDGDACVGWRAIPPSPCAPISMVRRGAEVAVRCAEGVDYALLPTGTWDLRDGPAEPIVPLAPPEPALPFAEPIVVALPDGERVATHGDVYAHPAAWRTHDDGILHPTVAPPSAFLSLGAALSADEALFVGRDAFVWTRRRR